MLQVVDFNGRQRRLPASAEGIWPAMADGVTANLADGPVPDPYKAGVVYRREERLADGSRPDQFLTAQKVIAKRKGDCEDLSAWLAAWLRQQGDSSARVGLVEFPLGGWHAVTLSRRRPPRQDPSVYPATEPRYRGAALYGGNDVGWNPAGWWVIDPSFGLGMRDPSVGSGYHPAVSRAEREPQVEGAISPEWVAVGALATAALVSSLKRTSLSPALWTLPWARLVSPAFMRGIVYIANEVQTDPRYLLATLYAESKLNPLALNPDTGAGGINQWMPKTARGMGTTVEAIRKLTAEQQLFFVLRYYQPAKGRLKSLADVYTWTFRPADLGLPLEADHFVMGQKGYSLNKSLDINRDGKIERWEPAVKAAKLLAAEEARQQTGIAGIAGADELLEELETLTTVASVAAYISRLKMIAPGNLMDTLTRWEKNVLGLTLAEAKGIAKNLTGHATETPKDYDPSAWQTVKNAASATASAALTMVNAPLNAASTALSWGEAAQGLSNDVQKSGGLPLLTLLALGLGGWWLMKGKK